MLSEKIKALRKQARLSQEQLAERLGVSRQAVTKWETGAGIPEIDNLRALAALFGITLDALLESQGVAAGREFLFDSVTEYDIDCEKSYDIVFAGAKLVSLWGYGGEKLQVRLSSNQLPDLQRGFKVKIDDVKKRIDVDVRRFAPMTEAKAKEALYICIQFPRQYTKRVEVSGNTQTLELRHMEAENVEFTGKAARALLRDVAGHVEINCNTDMELRCENLSGRLDINQISSTSRLAVPAGMAFAAVARGVANSIHYEREGKPAQDFSLQGEEGAACGNVIELNGLKSELVINAVAGPMDQVG